MVRVDWVDSGGALIFGSPPERSQTLTEPAPVTIRTVDELPATAPVGQQIVYQGLTYTREQNGWRQLVPVYQFAEELPLAEDVGDGATLIYDGTLMRSNGTLWAPTSSFGTEVLDAAPDMPEPGRTYYDTVQQTVLVWTGSTWVPLGVSTAPAAIDVLAAAPDSPEAGLIYFNTTDEVVYVWTGTAWVPLGVDLPEATPGIGVLAEAPAAPTEGQTYYDTALKTVRSWDGTAWLDLAAQGSAGGGLPSRQTVQYVTGPVVANGRETGVVTLAPTFSILSVTADVPCRVRLYASTALRDADATRAKETVPDGNHGLYMDVVIDSSETEWFLSPQVVGSSFNGSSVPVTIDVPGGGAAAVSFKFIRLEA